MPATIQEQLLLQEAKNLQAVNDHSKVIKLLKPFEKSINNMMLLDRLGRSYLMESLREPALIKDALRIFNVLLKRTKEQVPPNLLHIIDVLVSMTQCYGNDTRVREFFTKESLRYADNYAKTLQKTSQNKKVINGIYYKIYFNAAILHTHSTNCETNSITQSELFKKAKECYLKALEYRPGDLKCLLHYVRLSACFSIYSAIGILLPYEEQYQNDSSYNFCMEKLYENTEHQDRAQHYKKKYEKCLCT